MTPLALAALLALGAAQADTGRVEAVALETATGTIHGTLQLPGGGGPHPVALLIAGSGPTDRDGNSRMLPGANNSLKLLAEALAARGIATVRYDKRGVGESAAALAGGEAAIRFEHLADDAAAWLERLDGDPRFGPVAVIGHSEGSLIGMLAARRAGADAYASIAGPGRPAPEILREQLSRQLPPELMRQAERAIARLEAGESADSVPPMLAALFRPSVQPYLISWFRYDPAEEIAALELPVLIAQGTTDVQVGVEEARRLSAARPAARLVVVEGMNHVLKLAAAGDLSAYGDPALPVAPELVDALAAFLLSLR